MTVLQTGKIITSLSEVNLIPSAGNHLDFIKVLAIFSLESHSLTTAVESIMVTTSTPAETASQITNTPTSGQGMLMTPSTATTAGKILTTELTTSVSTTPPLLHSLQFQQQQLA